MIKAKYKFMVFIWWFPMLLFASMLVSAGRLKRNTTLGQYNIAIRTWFALKYKLISEETADRLLLLAERGCYEEARTTFFSAPNAGR